MYQHEWYTSHNLMQIAYDRQSRRTGNTLDPSTGTNEFIDDEVDDEENGWDEEHSEIHCVDFDRWFDVYRLRGGPKCASEV